MYIVGGIMRCKYYWWYNDVNNINSRISQVNGISVAIKQQLPRRLDHGYITRRGIGNQYFCTQSSRRKQNHEQ